MKVYPVYCQKCGKMLGVVVGSARVKCLACGDWIIIEKSGDDWRTRREVAM